jgi:hypothetical protein
MDDFTSIFKHCAAYLTRGQGILILWIFLSAQSILFNYFLLTFLQNISIRSKIYAKKNIYTRFVYSGVYSITPLPYPSTQSLLPFPLKPEFYTSPKNLHTCTLITDNFITCYKHDYGAEICNYNIIYVKLMIIDHYQSIYFWIWTRCKLRCLISFHASI